MKKHLLAGLATLVFVAGASGNVWADTISYNETVSPGIFLNAKGPVKSMEWVLFSY